MVKIKAYDDFTCCLVKVQIFAVEIAPKVQKAALHGVPDSQTS